MLTHLQRVHKTPFEVPGVHTGPGPVILPDGPIQPPVHPSLAFFTEALESNPELKTLLAAPDMAAHDRIAAKFPGLAEKAEDLLARLSELALAAYDNDKMSGEDTALAELIDLLNDLQEKHIGGVVLTTGFTRDCQGDFCRPVWPVVPVPIGIERWLD